MLRKLNSISFEISGEETVKKRNPFLIVKFESIESDLLLESAQIIQEIDSQENSTDFEESTFASIVDNISEPTQTPLLTTSNFPVCNTKPKQIAKTNSKQVFFSNYFWLSTLPFLLLMLTSF